MAVNAVGWDADRDDTMLDVGESRAYRALVTFEGLYRNVWPLRIESMGNVGIAAPDDAADISDYESHEYCAGLDADDYVATAASVPRKSDTEHYTFFCLRAGLEPGESSIEFYQNPDGPAGAGGGMRLHDMFVTVRPPDPEFTRDFTVSPLNRHFVRGVRYPISITFADDWNTASTSTVFTIVAAADAQTPDAPATSTAQTLAISHDDMGNRPPRRPNSRCSGRNPNLNAAGAIRMLSPAGDDDSLSFCLQVQATTTATAFLLSVTAEQEGGDPATSTKRFLLRIAPPDGSGGVGRAAQITRGDDELCGPDENLCLRPLLAQVCAEIGFRCESELFVHLLLLLACFGSALAPLVASLRIVGVITPPYFALSFVVLALTLSVAYRVAGLPSYYALAAILIILTLGVLGMSGRLSRLAG